MPPSAPTTVGIAVATTVASRAAMAMARRSPTTVRARLVLRSGMKIEGYDFETRRWQAFLQILLDRYNNPAGRGVLFHPCNERVVPGGYNAHPCVRSLERIDVGERCDIDDLEGVRLRPRRARERTIRPDRRSLDEGAEG